MLQTWGRPANDFIQVLFYLFARGHSAEAVEQRLCRTVLTMSLPFGPPLGIEKPALGRYRENRLCDRSANLF